MRRLYRRIHNAWSNAGRWVDTPIFPAMMKEIQRKETRHKRGAYTDVATGAGIDAAEVRHARPTVGSKPPADLVAKRRLVKFGHDLTLQQTSPKTRRENLRKYINFIPQTYHFQQFIELK